MGRSIPLFLGSGRRMRKPSSSCLPRCWGWPRMRVWAGSARSRWMDIRRPRVPRLMRTGMRGGCGGRRAGARRRGGGAEGAAIDAAEDAELGAARGDELPAELADPTTRAAKLRAALQELEQRKQAALEGAGETEAEGAAAGKELMRRVAAGQKTGPGKARRV